MRCFIYGEEGHHRSRCPKNPCAFKDKEAQSQFKIKKVYRKKALKCHPDKNPDNPSAAEEFDRLKKILEILLDPGARSAYDKLLKARKAAAIRARETDAKTQKLRSKLEEREKLAKAQPQISEEERLRRELKRLEEEGERLIEEELKRVNNEVKDELRRGKTQPKEESAKPADPGSHKVRVKWIATDDWPGYTEEEINQLFFKWGKINALVVSQKGKKGTALLDYDTKLGAVSSVCILKPLNLRPSVQNKPIIVVHTLKELVLLDSIPKAKYM
ncbi:dnaJ homolog subfamily C member 17-like isoform X1 [Oratosquilla oratoria]|uniref:dnaJ homolog subfamily C member 17-like isoform X1 n=1 Tax=Oratosquilla oratoria TaxID=337810 RepID=UPI003F7676EC